MAAVADHLRPGEGWYRNDFPLTWIFNLTTEVQQMTNFDFGTSREAMLRQVDEAGFAVVDANLYLDTHPCDAAAIDYNQMAQAYRSAADAFEAHSSGR